MGNFVGALGRKTVKKARRFNVERRTEKYLENKVKNPSPKPEATLREIVKINEEMPDLMENINKPNKVLLDHLKNVYVSSLDQPPVPKETEMDPNRPLPVQRETTSVEYGYVEPESVNAGYITLRQALQLLSKHQADKNRNNIENLALEYNLNEKDVGNIVENFKIYSLVTHESKGGDFDGSPMTFEDPTDKISFNVVTAPKYMKALEERVNAQPLESQKNSEKK